MVSAGVVYITKSVRMVTQKREGKFVKEGKSVLSNI